MPCSISCAISAIFLIGMIYFYNMTDKSEIVKHYKNTLTTDLQKRYDNIVKERRMISYRGYILGIFLSLFIIYYNLKIKKEKLNTTSLVCIVVATSFITNALFYMVSPKSDWMLDHVNNKEQVKAWLQMYKNMSFYYHSGLILGIIAVGIFAFAFRC
jgi:ABC-type Fe3+-siderophore transport system permease subunit